MPFGKKYNVEIKETLSRVVEVEADSKEIAESVVRGWYREGRIVLDDTDYVDTEIGCGSCVSWSESSASSLRGRGI